jgi:all-trans-retinol 13,14-reductase
MIGFRRSVCEFWVLSFEVIIIGSGLGGLLPGYLLSREGMNVCVLEKHKKFGGCLQSFKREEYSFDTGMHYVGSLAPGQTLHTYWKYFGLTELPWLQMDKDGFDVISFPDAEFGLAQGFDPFRDQLARYFPGSGSALKIYTDKLCEIARAHPLYNLEMPSPGTTGNHHAQKAADFLDYLGSTIEHRTPDTGHRFTEVLSGNNLLYSYHPSTTPLHQYGLISHSFISSAWRPAGGSQQIADKLVEGIRANGGTVMAKKEVTAIRNGENGFVIETSDGDSHTGKQIISGIHPASTLKLLDGIPVQKAFAERINGLENTPSVFSVYIGLKAGMFPYLNHNVYHQNETGRSFLFMTPPGRNQGEWAATAVILSAAGYSEFGEWEDSKTGKRNKSYWVFRAQKAHRLLEAVFAKFPELRAAIASIDISTPLTWRDYTGTPEGSMYGIVKSASEPHRTTVHPRTKVPGLFFTGQNVNLHGAVGVTIGAVMTCGELLGLPRVLKTIKNAL